MHVILLFFISIFFEFKIEAKRIKKDKLKSEFVKSDDLLIKTVNSKDILNIKNTNFFVILNIHADWCPSNLSIEKTIDEITKQMTCEKNNTSFWQLNIDSFEDSDPSISALSKLDITVNCLPMIVCFSKGKPIKIIEGKKNKEEIVAELNSITNLTII